MVVEFVRSNTHVHNHGESMVFPKYLQVRQCNHVKVIPHDVTVPTVSIENFILDKSAMETDIINYLERSVCISLLTAAV